MAGYAPIRGADVGFKVQRKIYNLKFQDEELAGLEVKAKGLNLGQLLEMMSAKATREAGGEGREEATRFMVHRLIDALVSWNAEDEDTGLPIPQTVDGVLSQDPEFYMAIIDAWTTAMNGVPAPLPETSIDGSTSVEASIPMDVPSSSLAS
jgi:hypothetical protein